MPIPERSAGRECRSEYAWWVWSETTYLAPRSWLLKADPVSTYMAFLRLSEVYKHMTAPVITA